MQRSTIEIITPAENFDLVTLEIVKSYLNITTSDDDIRLQTLITFASKVVADLCDRVFAEEEVTETIELESDLDSLESSSGIVLARYPIVSVDSISVDGSALTDFIIDSEAGTLHGAVSGTTVVTYTGGYTLPANAPGPLALATMDLIRQTYYFGSRDPFVQSISDSASGSIRFFPPPGIGRGAGGGGSANASPLSPSATALIKPYKRHALA